MSTLGRNDTIAMVDDRINRKMRPLFEEGTIFFVMGGVARVRTFGSSQIRNVEMDRVSSDDIGKNCLIYWSQQRGKYILVTISSGNAVSSSAVAGGSSTHLELFPPANLNSSDMFSGVITFRWDAPPQVPVAFEVQYNTTASESGATSDLITRGSYDLIESATDLYARVRSISSDFQYSSWTDWVLGSPGPPVALSLNDLTDVDTSGESIGEVLTFDGSFWVSSPIPDPALGLDDLTDVVITSPVIDDELIYDGTYWRNVPDLSGFLSDGTDTLTDGTDYLKSY